LKAGGGIDGNPMKELLWVGVEGNDRDGGSEGGSMPLAFANC